MTVTDYDGQYQQPSVWETIINTVGNVTSAAISNNNPATPPYVGTPTLNQGAAVAANTSGVTLSTNTLAIGALVVVALVLIFRK